MNFNYFSYAVSHQKTFVSDMHAPLQKHVTCDLASSKNKKLSLFLFFFSFHLCVQSKASREKHTQVNTNKEKNHEYKNIHKTITTVKRKVNFHSRALQFIIFLLFPRTHYSLLSLLFFL